MPLQNPKFAPLLPGNPIVDEKGAPNPFFIDWISDFASRVVQAVDNLNGAVNVLQSASAQVVASQQTNVAAAQTAGNAQKQADAAAGSTAQSGNATSIVSVPASGAWVAGPSVALGGVVAGHLTLGASGPSQGSAFIHHIGDFVGSWRVQEIIGGVETTVFTGNWTASRDDIFGENALYTLYNNTDASTVSLADATVGAITYRMDLNMPQCQVDNLVAFLTVRRGA